MTQVVFFNIDVDNEDFNIYTNMNNCSWCHITLIIHILYSLTQNESNRRKLVCINKVYIFCDTCAIKFITVNQSDLLMDLVSPVHGLSRDCYRIERCASTSRSVKGWSNRCVDQKSDHNSDLQSRDRYCTNHCAQQCTNDMYYVKWHSMKVVDEKIP